MVAFVAGTPYGDRRCSPEGGDGADGVYVIAEAGKAGADPSLNKVEASDGVLFDDAMLVLGRGCSI
jgi:hypothetical protein